MTYAIGDTIDYIASEIDQILKGKITNILLGGDTLYVIETHSGSSQIITEDLLKEAMLRQGLPNIVKKLQVI